MAEKTERSSLIYVLFGATGDLATRKIMPALARLYHDKLLPENSHIIAFSRRPWQDEDYHNFILPYLNSNTISNSKNNFLNIISYVQGTFDDTAGFKKLKEKILELRSDAAVVVYYLSVEPKYYELITNNLGALKLNFSDGENIKAKLFIEKPFGNDQQSAEHLEKNLEGNFSEQQIFRIDHYLAKPGLLAFIEDRKNNSQLESRLSSEYVQSITARIFEKIGIEGRGDFYDAEGALKDVGQNHLLEMLATATMNIENLSNNISLQEARADILKKLGLFDASIVQEKLLLAQYEGYHNEEGVAPHSQTETFFRIITYIKNDRWKNIQIILEAGKAMSAKRSEIEILFKDGSKKILDMEKVGSEISARDPYEVIVQQSIKEDKDTTNYFASFEEIVASWKFIDSIIKNKGKINLKYYKQNSENVV